MKTSRAYVCLSCDEVVERNFGLDDPLLVCPACQKPGPFWPIRNWINAPVEHSDFRGWIKQGFLHHERMIEAFDMALGNYDRVNDNGKRILDMLMGYHSKFKDQEGFKDVLDEIE